ncbi:MAG: winged helix-turn-helix domain-containing protein [Deltaproteobacteria bacterium]|nr:winged helix-turn-helix domain-containing protein [Deltaproteobacteria bacterium]
MAETRIMLVEDNMKLAGLVREYLENKDFEVIHQPTGDGAVDRILAEKPDLIILDLMLPGMDGKSICRAVRPFFSGPILMLTALGEEVDEVVGLELGADDYVVKPVRPRVLLARIQTLLRRTATMAQPAQKGENESIVFGALNIHSVNREVRVDGVLLDLSTAEYDLLLYLVNHAGHVLSRSRIYEDVRGIEWDGMDRSIDQRITRLRRKLGDDASEPRWIKSVRGEGYLMAVPS